MPGPTVASGGTLGNMNRRPFIHTHERLAEVFNEAITESGLTWEQVAEQSGADKQFLTDLSRAHPRGEIGLTFRVLESLGVQARALPSRPSWSYGEDGRLKNKSA